MTRLHYHERDYYPVVVSRLAELGIEDVYHTYDSRRSRHGYPDFTIAAGPRWLLFAELKAKDHPPTPAQWRWLHVLRGPWRASAIVHVDSVDELAQLAANMKKPGALDAFGEPGFGGIVVLGPVRLPPGFDGGVLVGRSRPAAADPAAAPRASASPRRLRRR